MQMQSMQMQKNVMDSLKGSSAVMAKINEDMNVNEIRDVMKEFQKETMKAEINSEMMGDAMDAMEDPNAAADADDVYNGILGEIGLEYTEGNAAIPTTAIKTNEEEEKVAEPENDDLEARLAALRMAWKNSQLFATGTTFEAIWRTLIKSAYTNSSTIIIKLLSYELIRNRQ